MGHMRRGPWSIVAALAVTLALPAGASAQDDTDPGTEPWQQVPRERMAAECGMDPDVLDAAAPKLAATPFVVIRHGKLCWEGGWPGGTTQPYSVYSVTKSFGALLVGIVDARSSLSDADVVTRWLPEAELGAINPKARLAHVLAMVATNPDLSPGRKGAWSYDTTGSREINKLVPVMDRAIAAEPAGFPGVKDSKELAEEGLFAPLGMRDSTWPGGVIGGNLTTTVRDMARMGQLVLQRGRWNGEQLLDESFVYKMTHAAFEDVNTGYGYLTYVNAAGGWSYPTSTNDTNCSPYGQWARYPHGPLFEAEDSNGSVPGERVQRYDMGTTFASGTGGQKFTVYRGLDMVIAIRDSAISVADGGTVVDQFPGHKVVWNALRPALLEHDPLYRGDEAAFCAAFRRSEYAPSLREAWTAKASGGEDDIAVAAAGAVGTGTVAGTAAPGSSPIAATTAPPVLTRPCASRRRIVMRLPRPRGARVTSRRVTVDGRRVPVRRGRGVVDLRGRGPGRAVVRITVRGERDGRPVVRRVVKTYRTCGG